MAFTSQLGLARSRPGNIVPGYSPAAAPWAIGPAPPVKLDPEAKNRTRGHQQIVAAMLNSLVRRNELQQIEDQNWTLGFVTSDANLWGSTLPTTVGGAIDELASRTAAIGFQPLDSTLTALAAFNTNGVICQTAADTFAGRTITGTANQITVSRGDGVSGDPTLSLPADVLIPTVLTVPNVGLHLLDTDASHDLIIKPGSNLAADRTLTITTGDSNRTLTLSGDATISGTNTGDETAAGILTKLLTVDGSGSGLDADLLDGNSSAAFALASHTHAISDLTDLNVFKTISVSGQSDIVGDSGTDTLTVAAGSNITITTNAGTDTLTIAGQHPKLHMDGLRNIWSSTTAIVINTGSCRDDANAADITLSSNTTVSITTLNAIDGTDEKTLVATATTHATATFEPSASVWSETAFTTIVRTGTGTLASTGTAVTGTGTKFLSEVAVGDVIRSNAKGASRVTTITSDTALTLVAAFPDGDTTALSYTIYENLNVKIASEAGQRVNTITNAGTSVVVPSAWTSNTSGVAIKVGVEIVSSWYFPWIVSGGSGTGIILSTQRTTPFGVTGYTTSKRRIPCAIYNNASGNIDNFEDTYGGPERLIFWIDDGIHSILNGGAATVATKLETTIGCPATASALIIRGALFDARFVSTAGFVVMSLSSNRAGGTTFNGGIGIQAGTTAATAGINYSSGLPIAMESSGGLYYILSLGGTGGLSTSPAFINAMGWWELAK